MSAWRYVLLAALLLGRPVSAVTVEKLLPFTPGVDSVRIQVVLQGDGQAGPLEVRAIIEPLKGGDAVWKGPIGQVEPAAAGADSISVEHLIDQLKVQPWSPGSPNLYKATVIVLRNNNQVATKTVRFGFRSFQAKDGHCYLNGKPIFLRGIAINPPGRTVPEKVGESKQFAHDYVKYLRGQNVNLIRLEHDNQDWFDACDELGMMVYQGFYGSPPTGMTKAEEAAAAAERGLEAQDEAVGKKLPRDFDKSMRAYQDAFEPYVHHPSIVIYILTNEMPYKGKTGEAVHEFLTKAYEHLSKWDHTRAYIGNAGYGEGHEGDINDVHRYWGWYYNSFLTYYNLRDPKLFGEFDKNQPFTFSECVGCFTGPTGAWNYIERKQLAAGLGWTGHDADQPEEAQVYQAFMVKQATESFRRMRSINPRISGLMPFTITFHNWRGIKSFDQMKPTAASKQFGVSYQPVLLSWESWQPQVYAGTTIHPIAHVINDADDFSDLTDGSLTYELRSRQGNAVVSGKMDLPAVTYYGTWKSAIELALPEKLPSGEYTLVGQVKKSGKTVSSNDTPIFIAGGEWKQNIKAGKRGIVVVNAPATDGAIKKLGLHTESAREFDKLDPSSDCLVIGEEAWKSLASSREKLQEFIRAGGRVLCLGQKHDEFDASWLPGGVELCKTSATDPDYSGQVRPQFDQTHINLERPEHPVFSGVDRDRLKLSSDYTGWDQTKPRFPRVSPMRFGYKLTKPDDLGKIAVLADYDRGLEGIALAEMFDGKGSVLLCGLDLIGRIGVDPVADRILSNMLAYMTSDTAKHDPHPLIKDPIHWGDFATEHGVIGSPVYGFFYNTDWTPPPTEPDAKPLTDAAGGWNTKPSDQFLPKGIRPRGPFTYTFNCGPRDGTKSPEGTGIFFATIPVGRAKVVTKVRNDTREAIMLQVNVNEGKPTKHDIPPGQTITVSTPIPSKATDVSVRYTGNRELIILETAFQ